jgi:hypothetical protein
MTRISHLWQGQGAQGMFRLQQQQQIGENQLMGLRMGLILWSSQFLIRGVDRVEYK